MRGRLGGDQEISGSCVYIQYIPASYPSASGSAMPDARRPSIGIQRNMNSPAARTSKPHLQATRVAKRIRPTQPGAIKLAEQYGERLVCVRYRHDATGRYRYTTVELVVARSLVKPRPKRQQQTKLQIVAIRLANAENDLHRLVHAHGGVWDGKARLWYLTHAATKALGLLNRVV